MGAKLGTALRLFGVDESAIVTIQTVMFSVMLFGGVGLMMDFGVAYSAHSQMQGYIDQVALSAAKQLDGRPDAISRATSAAHNVSKTSTFVAGDGVFEISDLVFMTDAPTDATGSFSAALAQNYVTTNATKSKYVLAIASTESVTLKLLRFATEGNSGMTSIDLVTSAVATSRQVACDDLTSIVMCNPFETSGTTSWQAEMDNSVGYRMKLTADQIYGQQPTNAANGNHGSGNYNKIRMGLLKSPHDLMEVRNMVCEDGALLPGFASSSLTKEDLRDMCMLAIASSGLSCVNNEVAIKAAHPATVTTGLDVVFDMYDGPFEDILDSSSDTSFAHDFPSTLGLPSTINRASLFAPDTVASHGRMTREDYARYLDDAQQQLDSSGMSESAKIGYQAAIDNQRAVYGVDPSIPEHSRLNYVFPESERSTWGPADLHPCLDAENCTAAGGPHPAIYAPSIGAANVNSLVGSYYKPFLAKQVADNNPTLYDDFWDVPRSLIDPVALTGNLPTFHAFYANVEKQNPDLWSSDASDGHTGNGTIPYQMSLDADGNPQNPDGYGSFGIQTGAANYARAYPSVPIDNSERRVQRVTIVNCEGAQSYAAATGNPDRAFSDTYIAEIVDVADVFVATPPMVRACDTAVPGDVHNNNLCDNSQITKAEIEVEVVNAASMNPEQFDSRYYAVLVH